jgi:signal transduction histidine kinase
MTEGPGRLRHLSLRARLTLLLGFVAAFLLATLALQLAYQTRLNAERDDLVRRVGRAAETLGDLRTAVVDQQSGVRGFMLTGAPPFLDRYEQAGDAADDAFARLESLLGDSPASISELDAIGAALSDWRRLTAEPAVDPSPAPATRSAAFVAQGEARFDAVRDAIDTLDTRLEDERAADIDDLDRTYRASTIVMFVQFCGLVVLGAVFAVALSRQVLSPLARLGRDARTVADGDLARRVRGHGPPELVRMGDDVEAMRARIVAELDELTAIRADLERQAVELARSNDDLEQFAYVASHDLQEPLRKVSGFCQLLERRYADQLDDRAKEYIRFASDGAKRMQVLINDLLAFARVGRTTEQFRQVDLDAVAAGAVDALADVIEATGATVTIGDLPEVTGDPRLLGAVFQNLIGNAVKFHGDDEPQVNVSAWCQDDEWTVTVSDNGIGVDPEYADQIFTLFGRLHPRSDYQGTGIGLALSKKIVEFHGGRIWLEPTDDRGATFAFTLPSQGRRAAPATRTETDDDPQ